MGVSSSRKHTALVHFLKMTKYSVRKDEIESSNEEKKETESAERDQI